MLFLLRRVKRRVIEETIDYSFWKDDYGEAQLRSYDPAEQSISIDFRADDGKITTLNGALTQDRENDIVYIDLEPINWRVVSGPSRAVVAKVVGSPPLDSTNGVSKRKELIPFYTENPKTGSKQKFMADRDGLTIPLSKSGAMKIGLGIRIWSAGANARLFMEGSTSAQALVQSLRPCTTKSLPVSLRLQFDKIWR